MDIDTLKRGVVEAIEANREALFKVEDSIFSHPELGYKEFRTTDTVTGYLRGLGLDVEEGIAITGCRSQLNSTVEGPCLALMGELDAIVVDGHPNAAEGGVVHACGHNIQITALLGAVTGLIQSGALPFLDGKIDVIATPAEEFIELEYREKLRSEGKIRFFGGKQELIHRGYFDNVDMSIMFHSLDLGENSALVGPVSNGFIGKKVQFIGKASHAGSAPEEGINALNAAMLAIMNVQAQRETFKDSDRVRVHPIITKGGDIVNVVPADVRIESYVRARSLEGIIDANRKVNRALKAGADAVGAGIEITDIPGYLPINRYREMDALFQSNLEALGYTGRVVEGGDFTGSFDFGDISQLMPSLHPMVGGVRGALHTQEFSITDRKLASLVPAQAMAMTVIDLLYEKAGKARAIIESCPPKMTKESYLSFMDEIVAPTAN